MFRRFALILLGAVFGGVAFVLPADATAGTFRVAARSSTSEYGVVVWDSPNCYGYARTIYPGGSRGGSRVDSFKVYAKRGAYKLNSGSWRTAYTGHCYNVSAALVTAKAWD